MMQFVGPSLEDLGKFLLLYISTVNSAKAEMISPLYMGLIQLSLRSTHGG